MVDQKNLFLYLLERAVSIHKIDALLTVAVPSAHTTVSPARTGGQALIHLQVTGEEMAAGSTPEQAKELITVATMNFSTVLRKFAWKVVAKHAMPSGCFKTRQCLTHFRECLSRACLGKSSDLLPEAASNGATTTACVTAPGLSPGR